MDANGLCTWTQDINDEINWIRSHGPTPSASTGPAGDHTSGGGIILLCLDYPSSHVMSAESEFASPASHQQPACVLLVQLHRQASLRTLTVTARYVLQQQFFYRSLFIRGSLHAC